MKRRQRDDPVALVIDVTSSSSSDEEETNESSSSKGGCKNCSKARRKCSSVVSGSFPCKRCKEKKLECIPLSEQKKTKKKQVKSSKTSSSSRKSTNQLGQDIVSKPIKTEEEPPKKKRVVKEESDDNRPEKPTRPNKSNMPNINRFEQYLERLRSMEASDDEGASNPVPMMFVARWPNGDLNLFSASTLSQAKLMLNEIADPGTVKIYEYDGPLFFGFSPTVRPLTFAEQHMSLQISTLSKTRDTPLHQHFIELYKKQHMFDCKFRVYNEETKLDEDLECHSAVVLSYSPYLRSLVKPTATEPVFKFGNKFHYVNKNSVANVIEFLYLGKKIVGSMSELFDIILCSILLDIEELKHAACLAIICKIFKESHTSPIRPERAAKIVGVLHFADEHFLQLLIQAIFNRIARENLGEDLKNQGLSKHLSDKLKNWQQYRDGVVWNEEGLTKDISMKLDDSSSYGMKMWHKITKTAFSNRQFCQSKDDLKEVIIAEKTEYEIMASPQTLKRMEKSRVTDNDVLRSLYGSD